MPGISTGYRSGSGWSREGDEEEQEQEERRVEGKAREDRYVEAVRNRSLAQAGKTQHPYAHTQNQDYKTEKGTHHVNSFPHSVLTAEMSARHCPHSASQTWRRSSVAP
jgi:hypothetical protein